MSGSERETVLATKPAILQRTSKEKIQGKLTVSRLTLNFKPDDVRTTEPVNVETKSIQGQQKAKGKPFLRVATTSGPLVFEFQDVDARDWVVDILQSLLKVGGSQAGKSGHSSREQKDKLSGPNAEAKRKILDENRDVKELFNSLVRSGVISEPEFWKTRSHLFGKSSQNLNKQKIGLPSQFAAEMISEGDGKTQKIRVQLTTENVRQIFAERPHVHQAFLEHVPHHLDEKQFWSKFCRHEYALQQKRKKIAEGKIYEANQIDDEFADLFSESVPTEADIREARSRARCVNPTINLAANDDGALYEGYGVLHHAGKANLTRKVGAANDIIRDVNMHANVVLNGVPEGEIGDPSAAARRLAVEKRDQQQKYSAVSRAEIDEESFLIVQQREGRPLEDLRGSGTEQLSELRIKNIRDYMGAGDQPPAHTKKQSQSQLDVDDAMDVDGNDEDRQGGGLEGVSPGSLRKMRPLGRLAGQVLVDLFHGGGDAVSENMASEHTSANRNPAEVLPAQLLDVLRLKSLTVNELLRHFWACYPINSAARDTKVNKLKVAITAQYESLKELQGACGGDERPYMDQMANPVFDAVQSAFAKYDSDAARRASKRQKSQPIAA